MRKLLVAAILAGVVSGAEAAKYTIDTAHSSVGFKIRHLVSQTRGGFNEFAGTIDFDEKKPEETKVEAVIQTASIDTANAKRDGHLRTADFFDVEKFPTITFKSAKVKAAGKGKYKMEGLLNMHGVEKPVTLDVVFGGGMKNKKGKLLAGFSAEGKINRKEFGITYNQVLDAGSLALGEEVSITLEIEAVEAE